MRQITRKRRTDYGTMILHWILVFALIVAIASGLRIASEAPGRGWINLLDLVLPRTMVWTAHIPAAMILIAVSVSYAVYMSLSGLGRRIRLDRPRLSGLFGAQSARWAALNVLLYWMFYLTLSAELLSGGALYFGYASKTMVNIHWYGMWLILIYSLVHFVLQAKSGGVQQLMRIFRPAPLVRPAPPVDTVALLTLLAERARPPGPAERQPRAARDRRENALSARGSTSSIEAILHEVDADPGAGRPDILDNAARPRRRGPVVQANPLVVAIAAALALTAFLIGIERQTADVLIVSRIAASDVPILDGDTSDPVWRHVRPTSVHTERGGNFDGGGDTTVEISAVHDGTWIYFLFVWNDPTRSLKQLPLVKGRDGWHLLHDGYEIGDEHTYNEDKFSVLLTKSDDVLAGDRTFHAGPRPISDKPRTLSGRGLHFGDTVTDVWQWKATSNGMSGWLDDDYFGPPAEPNQAEASGLTPYRGGFAPDPGTANYQDNFDPPPPGAFDKPMKPRRLPKNFRATMAALGPIDLDPEHGESESARWFMTDEESAPYSPELDAQIPSGVVIPGVIVSGEYSGDRADVRCAARWAAGRWALEVARRLDTHSPYDVAISSGTFLRVAAFDHSQIRHTRHVRPVRLEVQ